MPVLANATSSVGESAILPGVRKRLGEKQRVSVSISIVGPGNLGTALAASLADAGYEVSAVVSRNPSSETRKLARRVRARVIKLGKAPLTSDVVWITVPDDAIALTGQALHDSASWKGKVVFHSSGALTSDELAPLRKRGARVASVHPMMTFVRGSQPKMAGVSFSIEGDPPAVRLARDIVENLGGAAFLINKRSKVLYHAFGAFTSPLVIALMATMEEVAQAAGIGKQDIKTIMAPLLWQTLNNYLKHNAAAAFSGPLARGDVATVRKHLRELRSLPEARRVYVALAKAALKTLPVRNVREMKQALKA